MSYRTLTPRQVLDSLDAVGLRGDGRILQLNSYENRVFQVLLEDGRAVVAKFYRPGRWSDEQIVEEHAFALELAAAEVSVVPPLVLQAEPGAPGLVLHGDPPTLACHQVEGATHRFAVANRCAGREPELDDPATLAQLGRFIGRLHAVGRRRPFVHRHHLDPRADGQRALTLLLHGEFVPPTEQPAWQAAVNRRWTWPRPPSTRRRPWPRCACTATATAATCSGATPAPNVVDLDDAMQGPAVQDLWMLVSGDAATMAQQLNTLLAGYEQFADFDDRERALIEPLRTLRMVRHSAWLAERWGDPTFPINFPFFGTAAYWNQQTTQLREQIEAMAS